MNFVICPACIVADRARKMPEWAKAYHEICTQPCDCTHDVGDEDYASF